MILNFANKTAQDIYDGVLTRYARKVSIELHNKIRLLFDQIDAAYSLNDLKSPPGNHLKRLKGRLAEKWSIRVNDQWRIIFEWNGNDALNVEIIDYH